MPDFRRYYIPDSIIFITCVTRDRRPLLASDFAMDLYWRILRNVQQIHPFHLVAYAILPDHFHWLMQMPSEESNFSKVIQSFKRNFTLEYKKSIHLTGETVLWQARFWDHVIRNAEDLERHTNYIHYNPIKHGAEDGIMNQKRSSYPFWFEKGYYADGLCDVITESTLNFGE